MNAPTSSTSPARPPATSPSDTACTAARAPQLAREQLRITLELLTTRLPGLRLAEDRPVVMRPTMIHRSPGGAPAVW